MKPQTNARQRSMPRWLRRTLTATVLAAMVGGYLAGVALLTRNGWIDARIAEAREAIALRVADAGFRVQSVRVVGAEKTEMPALHEAVGVRKGEAIFAIDLQRTKQRVEGLPWVRVATIERSLPQTLIVRIVEREPLALWQRNGVVSLLDSTGTVVPDAPLVAFGDLPLLAGEGVPGAAPSLMTMLYEETDLAPRVTAASYVEDRRWNLLLDDRVWVKLPQTGALPAWRRLAHEERQNGVLRRNILAVDIRQPENWVFRLPPGERTRMALERNGG
jgi:cell division protein FtsQ